MFNGWVSEGVMQKGYIYKYLNIFVFRGGNMTSKNITLRVKSELYDKYRELCKKKGLLVSRQFEICMEEQLKGGK